MQAVRIIDNVPEITVYTDTAAHAALDVVCQPVEVPLIAQKNGTAVIMSLVLHDYDDQGVALEAVVLRSPISVGANNATMTISDSNLAEVLGVIDIGTGDYFDLPNNQVATVTNIGLEVLPAQTTSESVWIALRAATGSTPTYASGRLTMHVGSLRG